MSRPKHYSEHYFGKELYYHIKFLKHPFFRFRDNYIKLANNQFIILVQINKIFWATFKQLDIILLL